MAFVLVDARQNGGLARGHAHIVDQELGAEVVRAIDHQVPAGDDVGGILCVEAQAIGLYVDIGIERAQPLGRELCLGLSYGGKTVQRLTVQVRGFQAVAIDDSDATDPCARQVAQHRNTQSSGTDHQDARRAQFRLAGFTNFLQRLLARVVGGGPGRRRLRRRVRHCMIMVRVVIGVVMVLGDDCAALAVHPAGVTIDVVLLLPDRDAMLHLIDDVAAGQKGLLAVARAHAYPYGHLTELQITNAVDAGGVLDAEALDRRGKDALAFLGRE